MKPYILKRLFRHVGRLRYLIVVMFLLYSVMGLGHNNWQFYAGLVTSILWSPIWILVTLGRLTNIGWNRWLILPLLLPWAAFIWVLLLPSGRLAWFLIAMSVVVAAELPLIVAPGQEIEEGEELFDR